MKKAILVIPTYNERDNIPKLVEALEAVLTKIKDWKVEALIVDDNSPDKTHELVNTLTKKKAWLHLLVNPRKSGLGGAYLKGFAYAFDKLNADVVFEFDADLSHDPKKIPAFLEKIDEGYDLVLGSRYIDGGGIPDNWGLHRKFLSVVGNTVITLVLTNFQIHDWTTGFRALTREVYEKTSPELTSERFLGYTFQIGLLHKALRHNFKITEVPFKFVDRTIGSSKLGPEYVKNTLMYLFKVRIQELMASRVFKFAFVGGLGAFIQLSSLHFYRYLVPVNHLPILTAYQEATLLSIETAVVSNFILSNFWTFGDRRLKPAQIPLKFIQFNAASFGSILVQFLINSGGERFIGLHRLFTIPIVGINLDTGFFFAVAGILVGMFWNFFAYTNIIWKKKA